MKLQVSKEKGIEVVGPGGVLLCHVRLRKGKPALVREVGSKLWVSLGEGFEKSENDDFSVTDQPESVDYNGGRRC